jgi:hypothetical protein
MVRSQLTTPTLVLVTWIKLVIEEALHSPSGAGIVHMSPMPWTALAKNPSPSPGDNLLTNEYAIGGALDGSPVLEASPPWNLSVSFTWAVAEKLPLPYAQIQLQPRGCLRCSVCKACCGHGIPSPAQHGAKQRLKKWSKIDYAIPLSD